MPVDTRCIKKTAKGYRVSTQYKGKRLRKTYKTFKEALAALEEHVQGAKVKVVPKGEVTWLDLFNHSKRRRWKEPKKNSQKAVATRTIEKYLGWTNLVREFDQDCADYLEDKLEEKGIGPSTINHYFSAIRVMLRDGKRIKLVTWDIPFMAHRRQKKVRINYFTYEREEEIRKIIYFSGSPDLSLFFTLLIETGMRTSEVESLLWRDVDLDDCLIQVWGVATKTQKDRRIPITKRAIEVLEACKECSASDDRVFPYVTEIRRRGVWEKVREQMGNHDKDFVWYITRHTCATRLVKAGVDLHTVQLWLGHACIETTMRYIQFSASAFKNATRALENARNS